MSLSTPEKHARSCLVKLYTQAFYHGVANGGPRSVANYRIARAKAGDTFGSLAATALERYLEDCPHHADSVKVDIILDDQFFRLYPYDSLSLLEKGEVTHVILSLPPRLSRSARAASVSRAASVTRAASTRATTPPSKNRRRRSSTVQPASAPTEMQPVLISDSDSNSDDSSAVPVLKRASAKTRPSSVIGPQTSKSRAQTPKDAEVLSISSDADEDADDEATQKPQTRGQSLVERDSRREAMQQSQSAELAGTKYKTSKVVQKAGPKPRSTSITDPWEVPSSEEDLQVKQERTTPLMAKSRVPVISATPAPPPARPPSLKPTTPAAIPSDAKIISITDTSVADESAESDVPSVRRQVPVSRQANGSGDRGLETRKSLPVMEKKNGKRPIQHRVNENIRFVSPATGSGNAEEGRAQKPPIAPRFSVANSRGVFPLYPKRGSQLETTVEASERPSVSRVSNSKSPHSQKAARLPSSDNETESQSDSEASVTSRGSNGERRFHVEELADDGLPKAFRAWQVKYGSTFRSEPDLPYLYIDDGPWEGLVVDGKHIGKYITGCRPPSLDLITHMIGKAVPQFSYLSEVADSSLGEENDDGGHEEVVLPPIDHGRRATPPSSWSDASHIREQFERECPPSNQELGTLMSSTPSRKPVQERQAPLLEQTPSQKTRSKVVGWEDEFNVTPDTERAMSQVETPQTKSHASALKKAKIVVEIAEPSEAQRAEYKKMPEVNAQVLASGLKRLSDINDKSEHIATASQESGLAVVDHVMSQSPVWLKTVDLSDFQTSTAPGTTGKRRGSTRKLAAETPSRPSTQVTTSSPLKRKGSLYEEQKDMALLGLSSSVSSEELSSTNADEPRKTLKLHAQDSPTKHLTRSSRRQRVAEPQKHKATNTQSLAQAQEKAIPMTQRRRKRRKRCKARQGRDKHAVKC